MKYITTLPLLALVLFVGACKDASVNFVQNGPFELEVTESVDLETADITYPDISPLLSHIQSELKYPETARLDKLEGRVLVSMVIGKDGSIEDAVIVRSVREDIDNAAISAMKTVPKVVPAKVNGEPVRL